GRKGCLILEMIYFLLKKGVFLLTFLSVGFIVFSNGISAEEGVNVNSFGATGSGKNDETVFIQKAIDSQSAKGGGIVHFPKGVYLVDASKSIVLRNNISLDFAKGAILKALPTNAEGYEILEIHNVNRVEILGDLEIIGDRNEHNETTGEWGFGISIRGSNDITIENVKISDCWGDGIYIGSTDNQNYNMNIKIVNPILNNNRRQGISIVSAVNLHVYNAKITNTNGTAPQSGIDIEPNFQNERIQNVNIINLSTSNNKGFGLQVMLLKLKGNSDPVSIHVDTIKDLKDGYQVINLEGVKGKINIGGFYYLSDTEIVPKPIIKEVTNNATQVNGRASAASTITVLIAGKVIGTAKVNASGEFRVTITKQKTGSNLEIFSSDKFGNKSASVIAQVQAAKYSDFTSSHWAFLEVSYLVDKKILTGYPDGRFLPEKNATRAEAAKMLSIALNLKTPKVNTLYKDVSSSHWAKDYIVAATNNGLFNGYPDGSFRPDQVLTRGEMSKLLVMAYKLEGNSSEEFLDVSNSWAKPHISILVKNGITRGFPNNTFQPDTATTRAQFSTFLARSMDEKFRRN
ncbi:S-layer homology domain-containing protein, partial [Planococcus glaciei]|uniref:S-layer homology domain-containing protein n=1 Tax=Planococcus glaciei TaxID=459472 RepID=UPI00069D80FB